MAGILDKIKGMFSGAKDTATDNNTNTNKAGDVNHRVGDPADQSGTTVEGTVPGHSDGDNDGR